MNRRPDPRVDAARLLSMREVINRLPLVDLSKVSGELTGPCPQCGGKDRFSINLTLEVFNCRICQAKGDGIALAQHVLGCDFLAAITHLVGEKDVEISPEELERRRLLQEQKKKKQDAESAKYRAWSKQRAAIIWRASGPFWGSPAEKYLRLRGISLDRTRFPLACFRFLPDHPYRKKIGKKSEVLHSGPALIAAIQDPSGRFQAIHQTWIDLSRPKGKAEIIRPDTGEFLTAKLVQGSQKGGAIRLSGTSSGPVLIVGEGVETTATVMARNVDPMASYWAGISLGNMAGIQKKESGKRHSGLPDLSDKRAFVPPPHVARLVFLQDMDSDFDATRAKLLSGLKRAQNQRPDLVIQIVEARPGQDFNDMTKG